MKTNSIENLYQSIYVMNEDVNQESIDLLMDQIHSFINSQLIRRDIGHDNPLHNEVYENCESAVMIVLSKYKDKGVEIMPYLTTTIHRTISSTLRKHYDSFNQFILSTPLDAQIATKNGDSTMTVDIADKNADFENEMLKNLSTKSLVQNISRDYSQKREFKWILSESQGLTDLAIAKKENISNSYIGRQKKAVKKEIIRKYLNEYKSID